MSTVQRFVDVNVPLQTAYAQWTQFESFPRFMEGVKEVRQLDDKHLHWVAEVGGKKQEWNADISEQIPNVRVAWRSTDGAPNAGAVDFHYVASDKTRVTLTMDYEPQGALENVGDALGFLDRRVKGDLDRFKKFIEERGAATGSWQGTIEDHPENLPSNTSM
jgi:uncharacterized membrane protein